MISDSGHLLVVGHELQPEHGPAPVAGDEEEHDGGVPEELLQPRAGLGQQLVYPEIFILTQTELMNCLL